MSPSTERVRTNIVTPPPGGMLLNSQRHSNSTAHAPVVGQHITPHIRWVAWVVLSLRDFIYVNLGLLPACRRAQQYNLHIFTS